MGRRPVRQIAVLVETDDSWGRDVVQGIAEYAQMFGPWMLLVAPRDGQGRLRLPDGGAGHGIIARLGSPAMAEHVRSAGVPAVDTDTIACAVWTGRVATDDAHRARLALEHLRNRGFERFAYFAPPSRRYSSLRGRQFLAAAAAAGFDCAEYKPGYRPGRKIGFAEQQRLIDRWLGGLSRPVGVFTVDADRGRQLAETCQLAGVAVPDEVAILAGDTDDLMCNVSSPPLSSVLLNSRRIGYRAAELLDRLMAGRRVPRKPILVEPLGVIARQSTDTLAIDDAEVVSAIRFIRTHAAAGINIGDVLEEVPVSRRSLELRFRKVLGRSPAEEIRHVKLEKAKGLLAESELPMARSPRLAASPT